MVSSDGEYEWFQTIAAPDVPRLVELLGGARGGRAPGERLERLTRPPAVDLERV